LRQYAIGDCTWQLLKDIIVILKSFQRATDLTTRQKYPTIYSTIPIYNFLLNMLEDNGKVFRNRIAETEETEELNTLIQQALKAAIDKLEKYYSKTDYPIYYIGTGK